MDLNKLTLGDKVIVASGILLFIAYFLDWFSFDTGVEGFGSNSVSYSGSDVGFLWSTLPMLIGLVMAAVVVVSKLFDVKLPDLPIPWGQVHLGLGVLAALLVVLKLLIGEDVLGFDLDRAFGLFIAAIAAIGLAVGGFLKFQEGDDAPVIDRGPGTAPF